MSFDPLARFSPEVQERLRAITTSASTGQAILPPPPRNTDPLARQLQHERFALNDEQAAIMDAVIGGDLDAVVRAKAGTGKTSTLEALARRLAISRPSERILYIAFNVSVRKEAEARMPHNVEARTGHSLAWGTRELEVRAKGMGRWDLSKVRPDLAASDEYRYLRTRPKAVGRVLSLAPSDAEIVERIVVAYAVSADDEISGLHLDALRIGGRLPETDLSERRLLDAARRMWEDKCRPLGTGRCRFRVSQDDLRKMWALERPDFTQPGSGARSPAQVLFLDEAQDTPPVLARIVDEHAGRMQRVVVGDESQAIYGFAGAEDYLSQIAPSMGADLPLRTSYRFGAAIAATANRFLEALEVQDPVTGAAPADAVGPLADADAVLTRTNAGMIEEIVHESRKGRKVGILAETRRDLVSLVETTAYLRDGAPKPQHLHSVLGRYDSWDEVLEAQEQTGGASGEFATALGIVRRWALPQLESIAQAAVEVSDVSRASCDVVVVTAHKAKGLEWDTVRIGDDFYGPDRKPPKISGTRYDDPEHLRLDYVAVTRAKKQVDLGSLDWILTYPGESPAPRRGALVVGRS